MMYGRLTVNPVSAERARAALEQAGLLRPE